jgi:hypothetical protein
MSVVTNNHKHGGKKKKKFVLSLFCRLKFKVKVATGLFSPLGAPERACFCFFQLLVAVSQHSMIHGCVTPISASVVKLPSLLLF